MMNKIVKKYSNLKRTNQNLPNGEEQKIVNKMKEKYGVSKPISYTTIKSWLYSKNILYKHRGTETLMSATDTAILKLPFKEERRTSHSQWLRDFSWQTHLFG